VEKADYLMGNYVVQAAISVAIGGAVGGAIALWLNKRRKKRAG
jgi:membrane associated rhomboid family serine protease